MADAIIQQIICPKCGKPKPFDDFSPRRDRPLGRASHCRDCVNTASKARNNSPKGVARDKGYRQQPRYKAVRNKRKRAKYKPKQDTERKRRYFNSEEYAVKRPVVNAGRRVYRKTPKVQAASRRNRLKRKYGMTPEDFDRMLLAQGGVCAICRKINVGGRTLVVDHDHQSGQVRGLLCTPCNTLIGRWSDSPSAALRAHDYLLAHRQLRLVV